MSFSTFSEAHPSIVVAAVPAPSTLRNSRRLTPFGAVPDAGEPSCSMLILLVVTRAAVVPRAEGWIRLSDVTVDAPAHVERRRLINLLHVLDLAVARLARHARVHVPHVREVNVLGELVDADPRHRLFLIPVGSELLNFWFPRRHNGVAAHTGADRGQTRIERFICGEMAVKAVNLQRVDVNRVAERDRLNGAVPFR